MQRFFILTFCLIFAFVVISYETKANEDINQRGAQPLGMSNKGEKITLRNFASSGGTNNNKKKRFSKSDVSNSILGATSKNSKGKSDLKPKTGYTMAGQERHGPSMEYLPDRVPCGGYNSGLYFDRCGVCGGNDECVDCFNVTWGKAKMDRCEVCDGANECVGCDGIAYINNPQDKPEYDICGKCGGDGTSCLDCSGIPNGGKVFDACGNCGGDGSECCGLHGNCSGHGTCSSSIGGCRCDVGWTGTICQARQNMCQLGSQFTPCNGRGTCNQDTGTCLCDEGWYGDQCHLNYCSGHGIYDSDLNVCVCKPGYSGSDCSICSEPPSGTAYLCMQKYKVIANGKMKQEGDLIAIISNSNPSQQAFVDTGIEWGESIPDTVEDARSLTREALESIVQPTISSRKRPVIDFMRIAVEEKEVAIHLMGISRLARKVPGIMILPGTSINGTTYGCDCRPATPVDEGQIYDVIDTQDSKSSTNSNSHSDDNKKGSGNPKSIIEMEKDAMDKIWGKKQNKEDVAHEEDQVGYNSLTIVKQRQRKEELEKPIFDKKQRIRYGAYTKNMNLIAHGRFYTKFVERRSPLDGLSAKSQQQQLVSMYKEDIAATRHDPEIIGIALRSSSSSDTDPNSAVTTTIVIVSVLASVLITMLGTACIFISKRSFEGNA